MKKTGFTLVEVVVVSALILLVSLVGFQTADIVAQREKEERLRYALLEMRAAMDLFRQEYPHKFPKSFAEMETKQRSVNNASSGFFLRRLPINPIFATITWEIASQTKRNYSSIIDEQNHWKLISSSTAIFGPAVIDGYIIDVRCPDPAYSSLRGDNYSQW